MLTLLVTQTGLRPCGCDARSGEKSDPKNQRELPVYGAVVTFVGCGGGGIHEKGG